MRGLQRKGTPVNKAELINEVAQKAPHAKAVAADVVDAVFDVMIDALPCRGGAPWRHVRLALDLCWAGSAVCLANSARAQVL